MTTLVALAGAYLIGAIPTSYLAARLGRGIDLREHGSRNLGATNVYRVLGWRYAVPVALLDIAKGAVPVVLGRALLPASATWLPVALGAAAVTGHVFSPYVGFKGGKGVATAGGMFFALAPLALTLALVLWVCIVWATGFVSLGSIGAAALFPVAARMLGADAATFWTAVGVALLIVVAHRANIRRLFAGTEHRFRTRPGAVT